jgi:CRISPR-associated protein (TIGR03986 family)
MNPTRPDRTAKAPYNFVPLPECVYTVEDGIEVAGQKIKPWEQHDRFVPGTHSGWIDLEIETLTPLYIRGPVARTEDGTWDARDGRLRPEPFTTPDGRPVIPGSSLRGMIRTLVEILAFAKIQPVSEAKPFYRTVAPDRIGKAYGERMRRGQGVQGGFLCRRGGEWVIQACKVLRVDRGKLRRFVSFRTTPDWTPPWPPQHGRCWIRREGETRRVSDIRIGRDRPNGSDWEAATLVITGSVPDKRREFVFLDPAEDVDPIRVPEKIWDRFHDEDQITQWQERAFPRDKPRPGCRPRDGYLRDGEPVFFLVDESQKSEENPDGLVFLGRAGMFRLPYDLSPFDLVPGHIRNAPLDLAEAMFGKVGKDESIKGRVFFEDAVATDGGPAWFGEVLVPRILSSPKPTTFQHYLTQDGTKGKRELTTYLQGDQTTIRGHKLYWHRWDEGQGIDQVKESNQHDALLKDLKQEHPRDTQHTIIRPVKAGVRFGGRIRFDNLTDLELGALLCALQLPEGCAHRLGMGKPLGLGSVHITARLHLVDRRARYRSWRAAGVDNDEAGERFRATFENAMLAHARRTGETMLQGQQGLRQIARLDALFRMLEWTQPPPVEATRYMRIEDGDPNQYPPDKQGKVNEFRTRPVLPTPHGVLGLEEPPWRNDPPRPGNAQTPASSPARATGPSGSPPSARTASTSSRLAPGPSQNFKPVQKGQTRSGTLRRSGNTWVTVFEGDPREARIVNPEKIPADCEDGARAEFYITRQSKREGIVCRFERLFDKETRG